MLRRGGATLFLLALACEDGTNLGATQPRLEPLPEQLDFQGVYLGAQKEQVLELFNGGAGPLRIISTAVSGPGFGLLEGPELIYPGNRGLVRLSFAPKEVGPVQGQVLVATDQADHPLWEVQLRGTGLAPLDCDDHNDCTVDHFDAEAGLCGHDPREGACDDGSACTEEDRCSAGACLGRAINCDDGVDCTDDLCDQATGCVAVARDERCTDDDPCSLDRCSSSGCEHPPAPDGYLCGEVVSCVSAEICLLHRCLEVPIPEGAPCDDGNACTEQDACQAEVCTGTPAAHPPEVVGASTLILGPDSGTLNGDRLYVATPVADRLRFKVLAMGSGYLAPTHPEPALDGPAQLTRISPTAFARVSTSTSNVRILETFDATDRDHLVRLSRTVVGYWNRSDPTATVSGGYLYFCAAPGPSLPPQLTSVDVGDPAQPRSPTPLSVFGCADSQTGFTAAEDIWISWDNDFSGSAGWQVLRLSGPTATLIDSHGFNTQGVHRYGAIQNLKTDGHRAVVDLENDRYFWALDLDQSPVARSFGEVSNLPDAHLLAVRGARASYVLQGTRIQEVDVTQITAPQLLPDGIQLPARDPSLRLLAVDDQHLALALGQGLLQLYARVPTGLVAGPQTRGQGSVARLYAQASGLLALGSGWGTFLPTGSLPPSSLATIPNPSRLPGVETFFLDGPDGPAGIYAKMLQSELSVCSPFLWGCDLRQPVPVVNNSVSQVGLAADGTVTATLAFVQMTGEQSPILGANGCLGAGFDNYSRADRFLVVDRCINPGHVEIVAEIPNTVSSAYSVVWTRVLIHQPGWATFVGRGFLILFDFTQPLAPVVAAERYLSNGATGGFLGADFDGQHWVNTRLDDQGQFVLETFLFQGGTLARIGTGYFDPQEGLPIRNVLRIDWPLAYVGADRQGDALLQVYALDRAVPELLYTVDLPTPAVDLLKAQGRWHLARGDGITELAPACGP